MLIRLTSAPFHHTSSKLCVLVSNFTTTKEISHHNPSCITSQECQRADWKAHKTACQPYAVRPTLPSTRGLQNMVMNWVQRNYFLVMQELDRVTHLYSVPKRELVLVLDFYAKHGIAPALRTPNPIFEVGVTKDYLGDDRTKEPDWFFKGTDVYLIKVERYLTGMREEYELMTSKHVLTMLRYPTGASGVCSVHFDCAQGVDKPMFSDAALEAFSQIMRYDNDDGSLDQAYTPAFARSIREYRDQCRSAREETIVPSLDR